MPPISINGHRSTSESDIAFLTVIREHGGTEQTLYASARVSKSRNTGRLRAMLSQWETPEGEYVEDMRLRKQASAWLRSHWDSLAVGTSE